MIRTRKSCRKCLMTLVGVLGVLGISMQIFAIKSQGSYRLIFTNKIQTGVAIQKNFHWKNSTASASQHPDSPPLLPVADRKYHLLINSYMNSGSRFVSRFFGFRPDAFYFYEPLWLFSVWDYYHEQNLVCGSTFGPVACRSRSVSAINTIVQRGQKKTLVRLTNSTKNATDMMVNILKDIFNCNFSRIENLIVPAVHGDTSLSGPSWSPYKNCLLSREPNHICIRRQEEICRKADFIVVKVLRLTTSALAPLLETNDNIKVIQLFRDPRAVINSRMESRGYPAKDYNINSKLLCKKMSLDVKGGLELTRKHPDKFKFIFYEDIKENVNYKIGKLYRFIGMTSSDNIINHLDQVMPNKGKTRSLTVNRKSDNANWWRKHLVISLVKQVQSNCKDVVRLFNLTEFNNVDELHNLSIPAMHLDHIYSIN